MDIKRLLYALEVIIKKYKIFEVGAEVSVEQGKKRQ